MAKSDSTKTTGFYFDSKKQRFRIAIQVTEAGRRVRRSRLLPDGVSEEEAAALANAMKTSALRELSGIEPSVAWPKIVARAVENKKSWICYIYKGAKQRARVKSQAFPLTMEELYEIAVRSNGRCEVTGIAFSDHIVGSARMRPMAPSLDRIDWRKGYSKDNCRMVCVAVNVAMFNWGEQFFKNLALGYVINQILAPHAPIFYANFRPTLFGNTSQVVENTTQS